MKSWYYQYGILAWLAVALITFTIALWWPWIFILPAVNMLWVYHHYWHNYPRVGIGAIWLAVVALGTVIGLTT